MTRRKGERPIPRELDRWSPDHPVARAIRSGTNWFSAWQMQKGKCWQSLSRAIGMSARRFEAICQGDYISRAELDALAVAWAVSAGDLISSMPTPHLVVE